MHSRFHRLWFAASLNAERNGSSQRGIHEMKKLDSAGLRAGLHDNRRQPVDPLHNFRQLRKQMLEFVQLSVYGRRLFECKLCRGPLTLLTQFTGERLSACVKERL